MFKSILTLTFAVMALISLSMQQSTLDQCLFYPYCRQTLKWDKIGSLTPSQAIVPPDPYHHTSYPVRLKISRKLLPSSIYKPNRRSDIGRVGYETSASYPEADWRDLWDEHEQAHHPHHHHHASLAHGWSSHWPSSWHHEHHHSSHQSPHHGWWGHSLDTAHDKTMTIHHYLPLLIVIGLGAFLVPLLSTFFTAMFTNGAFNCYQRQRKWSWSEAADAPFAVNSTLLSSKLADLWSRVERILRNDESTNGRLRRNLSKQ